jgi:hypothetical protein
MLLQVNMGVAPGYTGDDVSAPTDKSRVDFSSLDDDQIDVVSFNMVSP